MSIKPRCSEWFCIFGMLFFLSFPAWDEYHKWQQCRRYENRIDAFDQKTVSPLILPVERILAGETLAGRWVTARSRRSSTLIFRPMGVGDNSRYRVRFATQMCTSNFDDERTAEFRDGKSLLDRPVAEALGPVYQQLHFVRVGSRRVLIPDVRSKDTAGLLAAIHKAKSHNQWHDLKALAYIYEDRQ